jgi:uncharacterized repeat protein (TIGR02543 family)
MKRATVYILLFVFLIIAACFGTEEAAPTPTPVPPKPTEPEVYYSLVVSADPPEGGIVAPTTEKVLAGTVVQVQAKPVPGYEFTGWSGAVSLSDPSLDITMDEDKILTAHFTRLATNTPVPPTATPTPKHTPTPEATEAPGVCSLTEWCNDHVGCESFQVQNQSSFAIGIYLRHDDSSVSCEYYVPPKGNLQIMLRPGRYYYIFTTCGGKYVYEGYHPLSSNWRWVQKAKFCK